MVRNYEKFCSPKLFHECKSFDVLENLLTSYFKKSFTKKVKYLKKIYVFLFFPFFFFFNVS